MYLSLEEIMCALFGRRKEVLFQAACGRHRHFESMGQSEKISTWEEEGQKKPRSHWSSLSIRKMGEVADGEMNEVNEGLI